MSWVRNKYIQECLFICLFASLFCVTGCGENKNLLYSKIGEVEDNMVGDYISYGSEEITSHGGHVGALIFSCYELLDAVYDGAQVNLSCLYIIEIPNYGGHEFGTIIYSVNKESAVEIEVELDQDGTSIHIEDAGGVASLISQIMLADDSGQAKLEIQLENHPETKLHFDLDGFRDEIKPATIIKEGLSYWQKTSKK
ncbi:MAG: hypothetical protein GY746_01490 [Gammaproteobacteria bacterium]|nr:hypothetical protein [Gammaproteobacteria bacterium]